MGISAVLALEKQTTNGVVSTGYVDIDIKPLEIEDGKVVMPGDQITLIPKVENKGVDCYLRIKINYINQDTDFIDYVSGFNSNFEKHGEYYYLKDVFKEGGMVELFNEIKIPEDVNLRINDKQIRLEIIAEAIQEKNFEPEYTLDNPWKDNIPTKTVNDLYNITDYSKVTVEYENDTEKDINLPDDFMKKIKSSMPGDSYTENVELHNSDKKNAKYYTTINTNSNDLKDVSLLKNIQLIITNSKGKVIYQGSLISDSKILLGEYNIGENDNFNFKISIPPELGNEFENLNPDLSITFSAEYDGSDTNDKKNNKSKEKNIKTGDRIDYSIIIFIVSTISFIIVCFLYKKENKSK